MHLTWETWLVASQPALLVPGLDGRAAANNVSCCGPDRSGDEMAAGEGTHIEMDDSQDEPTNFPNLAEPIQ